MFGSLRKKLNTAIQEGLIISESLQQQYKQRLTTPTEENSIQYNNNSPLRLSSLGDLDVGAVTPTDINLAAGCNLLAKYESAWKEIHNANDENAQKAEQIAKQITNIEQRVTQQRTTLTELNSSLAGLPTLVSKLKDSLNTLQEITALTAEAERQLEKLEDLCEECELQEFMLHKQCEFSQFKQKKMIELESYRQKVAAGHQEKIRQHEQQLRQIQRERQAVFDDAFRGDLEEFKQKGMIPKIYKEPSKELSLEEVTLEDTDTKDALEEFLKG